MLGEEIASRGMEGRGGVRRLPVGGGKAEVG